MPLIDLTLSIPSVDEAQRLFVGPHSDPRTVVSEEWKLPCGTALVYAFDHWGMAGTYIDFPGHIRETDDGTDAENYPVERLYAIPAGVIHLDREDGSGAIGADELAGALTTDSACGALIVNALGKRRFDDIAWRSVYLRNDAVRWMIDRGIHLLVSDVYESDADPQNVFFDLFRAGISTICCPVNMHRLTTPTVKLTVLPLRFAGVTQLPCRVLAELAPKAG